MPEEIRVIYGSTKFRGVRFLGHFCYEIALQKVVTNGQKIVIGLFRFDAERLRPVRYFEILISSNISVRKSTVVEAFFFPAMRFRTCFRGCVNTKR